MIRSYNIQHKKSVILIIILCLFVLLAVISIPLKNIHSLLARYNLLPNPEAYTELYFENHEKLPTRMYQTQQYSFSFSVHNMEYKNMSYPYVSYISSNNKKIMLQKGEIALQQNQTKTIPVSIDLQSDITKSEIVVNLVNKNQRIGFWVNE